MAISTNGTVLARLAGALYNTQMSNATYKEVAALDPSTLANVLYVRDFNMVSDATVATTLVTNLGLKAVAGLDNWVAAQLTAAGANKGAKVVDLLNSFAQMTADVTYGAAATAFNTKIDASLALSQTTDNKGGTFEAAGVVSVTGATFALTSAIDTLTGTAASDTFNGDFSVSGQVSVADAINGGAGTDKLVVSGFVGAVAAGSTTVAATVETQQLVLTGTATATLNTSFLGVVTASTIADTAAVTAGLIVANKANILAGATATAAGITDISNVGAVITLTYGGAGGTGDVPNIAAAAASNGITQGASAELLKGIAASSVATAATVQSVLPQLTSVETVEFANAIGNSDINLASTTKAATGVELFNFKDVSALSGKTITVSTGQGVQLATGNAAGPTAGTVTVAYAATATSADLILNGYQTAGTELAATLTGAAATTVNVNSTGAGTKNEISTLTLPATTTKLVVTGDKALGITTNLISGATATTLAEVNATANTGGVTTKFGAATASAFKFTGGSGSDVVILANDGLAALTTGAQIDFGAGSADKLGLFDTALTATETARINQTVGTDLLGLNAAITLEANTLTSIKKFSIDTTALTQVISGLQTGSTVSTGVAAPTSLTLVGDVGVSDVSIALAGAAAAVTVGTLVTTGLNNVTISSNGAVANVITTLTSSDNSTFTITGAQALAMTLSAGTAVGSKIDGSASSGILTLGGSTVVGSGDIIIGGSGADVITGNAGADKMTGGSGVDTFVFSGTTNANANGTTFGTNLDEITDFVAGTDKLQITGQTDIVSVQQAAVQAAVTALGATATAAQIAGAMATANTTNLGISFAVFGGSTYVLFEASGVATGDVTDDVFIKLTGVTTLPTFAVDVIA